MGKIIYHYNEKTLSYEKLKPSFKSRIFRFFGFVLASIFTAILIIIIAFTYIDSPKEKQLKTQIKSLEDQYRYLEKELNVAQSVLKNLQDRCS